MIVLTAMITGQLGEDEVGLGITAGQDTPEEIRDAMVEQAKRAVEHRWPGVTDVKQLGSWREFVVFDDEEDDHVEQGTDQQGHC